MSKNMMADSSEGGGLGSPTASAAPSVAMQTKGREPHRASGGLQEPLLEEVELFVRWLGPDYGHWADELKDLQARAAAGRYYLAVLGQFKRGKSTLLNALLGEQILPTSVVPVTAIPTYVRHGLSRGADVRFADGRVEHKEGTAEELVAFLAQYVAEEENPGNERDVVGVDVVHPAQILADGMILIDTPGIGSVFQHNTQATLNFLPMCDGALFVLSPDPPITEVELDFLREVRERIDTVFFVLSKIDYFEGNDRDKSIAFLRNVLAKELEGKAPSLFTVSARLGLVAARDGDEQARAANGIGSLSRRLADFARKEKTERLKRAVLAKAQRILAQVRLQIQVHQRAAEMPIGELEQRLALFRDTVERAERERQVSHDVLAGDLNRLTVDMERLTHELHARAMDELLSDLRAAMDDRQDEDAVRQTLTRSIPGLFEREFGAFSKVLSQRSADVLAPAQERADALIEGVRQGAAEVLDLPYEAPDGSRAFAVKAEPFWETHKWQTGLSPIPPGALDRFLPAGMRRRRRAKRMKVQIEALVDRNVENLRWTLVQSLKDSFGRFALELDDRLDQTIHATEGAMKEAADRRRGAKASMEPEVASIREQLAAVTGMEQRLADSLRA